MPKPEVSIITICKNSAPTIARTINSILESGVEVQYIIIDGVSTDGTQEIISSYGSRIDTFLSEPDDGISDAFNKGIKRATGEIIGIINSDDALLPGALTKIVDFLTQNPNVDIVHGDVLFYDGDYFIKRISPPSHWWLPWRMGTFNIHPATFVRRGVYERCGYFNTTYRFAMDDDLFMRCMNARMKIAYLSVPLVGVRGGGLSGRFAFKVFMEKRRALVENGFSSLLADVQCGTRCIGQVVVMLQQAVRRVRRMTVRSNDGNRI